MVLLSPPAEDRADLQDTRGPRRPRLPLLVVGLVVLLVVVLVAGGLLAYRHTRPSPANPGVRSGAAVRDAGDGRTVTPAAPRAQDAAPARRLDSLVTPQAPSAVTLPGGRVVPVKGVSTTEDGTLDVPEDISTAGWWRGGSRIGDPFGSILVAAHIDSTTQGLGPFAELLALRDGARVRVTTGRLRQDFTIRSRRLVPQGSLARRRWVFAASGPSRLTLVTCAPPYVKSRGGYQNLAVVTATAVGDPVRRQR